MSRIVVENLSTDDRAELLTSVLDCDATTISDCIFKIPALKLAFQTGCYLAWRNLLHLNEIKSISCFQKTTIVSDTLLFKGFVFRTN